MPDFRGVVGAGVTVRGAAAVLLGASAPPCAGVVLLVAGSVPAGTPVVAGTVAVEGLTLALGAAAAAVVVIVRVIAGGGGPVSPASLMPAAAITPSERAAIRASAAVGPFQFGEAARRVRAAAPQRRHHSCVG